MLQKMRDRDGRRLFGPVMLVWFIVLGALGVNGIAAYPGILRERRRRTGSGSSSMTP